MTTPQDNKPSKRKNRHLVTNGLFTIYAIVLFYLTARLCISQCSVVHTFLGYLFNIACSVIVYLALLGQANIARRFFNYYDERWNKPSDDDDED